MLYYFNRSTIHRKTEKKEQKEKSKNERKKFYIKAASMLETRTFEFGLLYIVNFEHLAHWTKSPGHLSKFKRKHDSMQRN